MASSIAVPDIQELPELPYGAAKRLIAELTAAKVDLDSVLRNTTRHLWAQALDGVAGTNPYVTAAAQSITLPDNAKCIPNNAGVGIIIQAAWARAGSGTLGPLSPVVTQTPTAVQVGSSWSGDLLFNATSAWTSVDIAYVPMRYDVVEATYTCTAGTGVVAGLPTGIIFILEAEILVGGATGKKIVAVPLATAPATGLASLSLGKTGVFFAIADAATSVRLKLGVVPAINL